MDGVGAGVKIGHLGVDALGIGSLLAVFLRLMEYGFVCDGRFKYIKTEPHSPTGGLMVLSMRHWSSHQVRIELVDDRRQKTANNDFV